MEVTWTEFKKFVTDRCLSVQWVEIGSNYHLKAFDGYFGLDCILPIGVDNADTNDFETNFKAAGNKSYSDIDGSIMIRPKAAKKGWVYCLLDVEFETSKLGSLYCKMADGTDRSGITPKLYNAAGTEITSTEDEATCVKSVISFEPPYDYEIIGGQLQQIEKPTVDVRVWVVAVPDVPAVYGGSKEMIGGANLKFVDPADKIMADGRVSKLMTYNATYHTNKLAFILKHDAGTQHKVMILVELFRA